MAPGAETGGFDGSTFQQIGVKSEIGDGKRIPGEQDIAANKAENNESVDFAAIDAKIEADQKRIDERNKQMAENTAKHEARMMSLKVEARANDEKEWHETRAKYGLPPKEFPVPQIEMKKVDQIPTGGQNTTTADSGDESYINEIGVDAIAGTGSDSRPMNESAPQQATSSKRNEYKPIDGAIRTMPAAVKPRPAGPVDGAIRTYEAPPATSGTVPDRKSPEAPMTRVVKEDGVRVDTRNP